MNIVMGEYYFGFIKGIVEKFVLNVFLEKIIVGNYGIFFMFLIIFLGLLFFFVVVFYFFMSILEDSGYFFRIVMFVDRVFNKIGLNGRVIIFIILGFGCVIMVIMIIRILGLKRERFIIMFLLGFIILCFV